MTSFRRELVSVFLVAVSGLAMALVFPYEALEFKVREEVEEPLASAGFVELSAEGRAAAIKAAKTTWQTTREELGGVFRLPLGELPEENSRLLMDTREIPCMGVPFERLPAPRSAWEPSVRAANPIRLEPEKAESEKPFFSRESLLEMK